MNFNHQKPFVVYHVGTFHFEPLVQLPKHQEGKIEFVASNIKFSNSGTNHSIEFTIQPGTLKKINFSEQTNNRFTNHDFNNKKKLIIFYDKNNNEEKEKYEDWKQMIEGGSSKIGGTFIIDCIDASAIATDIADLIQVPCSAY